MAEATHVVLAWLLCSVTGSGDASQGAAQRPTDLEQARAVIRPLLDAVYANADAFSSYYIRVESRPTRPGADDADGKDTGESLSIFEWWRNGDVCRLRITHRTGKPPRVPEIEPKVKKVTLEDGSQFISGIGVAGPMTSIEDWIGIRDKDALRTASSIRPDLQDHVFAPAQADLMHGPETWDRITPSPSVPFVLVPGGLSSRSALREVERALQTGDFRWNDRISLLGHRCVLVQVHTVRDVTQAFDPAAEPLRYRLHETTRVYFDACCPGAIRGIDHITRSERPDGSGGVNEHIERFVDVRRVQGRLWVHWKRVSETRIFRLTKPERQRKFSGVMEVQRCEFRPLRDDEGAIELSAGTRIYEAPEYGRVFVVPEDTVLTLANFESWVKKVRQQLLPAEIALRTPAANVGHLARPADRGSVSPLFVGFIFLLIPPLLFVLVRSIRRIRNRWRASASDGSGS